LLELKGLEEVKKCRVSSLVSSSLLVVNLISVERGIQSSLVLPLLLAVISGFNCLLSVLISSKRKTKEFFPGPDLASN
jgi:hypothetical protein